MGAAGRWRRRHCAHRAPSKIQARRGGESGYPPKAGGLGAGFPWRRWGHGPMGRVRRVSGRRMHVHKAKAAVDRAQLVGLDGRRLSVTTLNNPSFLPSASPPTPPPRAGHRCRGCWPAAEHMRPAGPALVGLALHLLTQQDAMDHPIDPAASSTSPQRRLLRYTLNTPTQCFD